MKVPDLFKAISQIWETALEEEERLTSFVEAAHPIHKDSVRNLIHYLAVRTFDLRKIQENLSSLAISSIGHSEGYTVENLKHILTLLHLLDKQKLLKEHTYTAFTKSKNVLGEKTKSLFGNRYKGSKIMVTLPTEAAEDIGLVRRLIKAGMVCARINTSHDSEAIWEEMISNVRVSSEALAKPCMIYMDLAGPKLRTGPVAALPDKSNKKKGKKSAFIPLQIGDKLQIYRRPVAGCPALFDENDQPLQPAVISLTLPSIFDDVKVGEKIWFDDGKIGGDIISVSPGMMEVEISHAGLKGSRLMADKGVNLPDTDIKLPPLTKKDEEVLPFIARHADMVGYSFVRTPEDVAYLQEQLKKLGREEIGVILKVETRNTFHNLPALLLQAMESPNVGVMIARGDLAVEVGWERISEIQEEILWLCEAAHIPIIWATQILENLAKKGQATRAEITDAAMSARAECAMLNKGPFIVETVMTLRNISKRMKAHQHKKMATLRPLRVAEYFFQWVKVPELV